MFRKYGNVLIAKMGYETLRIEAWGKNSLRLRATMGRKIIDLPGALHENTENEAEILLFKESAEIINGRIKAVISNKGHLRFINTKTNELILEEYHVPFQAHGRAYKSICGDMYSIEVSFVSNPKECIYGLGQHKHGFLNQKGCTIDLIQMNTEVSIPFAVSNRNYGFLWNNPAVGRVELAMNRTRWVAEETRQMDYWVTIGDTMADIMEQYTMATGRCVLLPEWAAGFWQSKLRYTSQKELLEVAREYKKRELPISAIVIDYFHWTMMGDWKFNPSYWPDPRAMVEELKELGIEIVVSIWCTLNVNSSNYAKMQEKGLLIRTERGVQAQNIFMDTQPEGGVYFHYYDPTNPETRLFVWNEVRKNYYTQGIKNFWLDVSEPEIMPYHPENLRCYLGNGKEIAGILPMMYAKCFYDGLKEEGETEILSLCRSAWAGSQRYGAAVWSGDIDPTFDSLRKQVRAGLNIGLSGIPHWTTDIGGFFGGDPGSPSYRELFIRWFQYGTFCPLFRLHGFREPHRVGGPLVVNGGPNEVWSYGEEAYEIARKYMMVRERIRPYIMEQMRLAHEKGIPPMRPLFFDFPEDENCWHIDDQYLFGPDLLVAPVLFEGERNREVYLPEGESWTHAWSDIQYEGGKKIMVDAPLDLLPLFIKGSKTIPIKD